MNFVEREEKVMQFILLLKGPADYEAGAPISEGILTRMVEYNEELMNAGVLIVAEGLQPSSKGARVSVSGRKRTMIDGPFAKSEELIAGFWLIQVKSKEAAIEWASRLSSVVDEEVEVRQLFDVNDFGDKFASRLVQQQSALAQHAAQLAAK
jgi:hypothetical protein